MNPDKPHSYIKPLNIRPRATRPQPKGLPIINLSFNELPYPPSGNVQNAINEATSQAHIYGNPSCEALRNVLADTWSLNPELLICGNGSEELLDVIGRVFATSGDEILISDYGYIQFPIVANRVGATLVKVPETDYTTDIDRLLTSVTNKTTLVFLANPNNPTGTMVDAESLSKLAQGLPPHVVLVIDLAYGEFASADYCKAVHLLVNQHENVIVTRTFSKAFGLAGLRIGWLHAPQWMIPSLYAARGMGTANAAAQAGAIAALADLQQIDTQIQTIVSERTRVSNSLSMAGIKVIQSSANFIMITTPNSNADGANRMAAHLFEDVGILVNQTRESGLEHFIRCSLSLPEFNTLLIESLDRFMRLAATR